MDRHARRRLVRTGVARQVDAEGGAVGIGLDLDPAAVRLGGALDQREAQAPAELAGGVSPAGKRLEDVAPLLGVERYALVVYRDDHAARLFIDGDGHRRILGAVLDPVRPQVPDGA